MNHSPRPRKTAELSKSLQQQLNMYALAAGAAGVGLLALAQPAEGKIIYTKVNKNIGPNNTLHLDLNHDGIRDFDFQDTYRTFNTFSCTGELAVTADRQKNAIWGHTVRGQGYASALYANVEIGPKGHFVYGGEMAAGTFAGGNRRAGAYGSGPWANVKNRYLGLKFVIKGQIHFGWARLNVSITNACTVTGNLTGYAYESVANRPILTGKKHGTEANDLAPMSNSSGTLGQLAGGSPNRFGR